MGGLFVGMVIVAAATSLPEVVTDVAGVVHGDETQISNLEPDAVEVPVAYVGTLVAVWSVVSGRRRHGLRDRWPADEGLRSLERDGW